MSLSRKLARLTGAGPSTPRAPEPAVVDEEPEDEKWSAFRSALGKKGERETARRAHARITPIPGDVADTEFGPLHTLVRRYGHVHRHGDAAIEPARDVTGSLLARLALDETLGDVDASRLVFLDTETTGLAGGTGTIPFLIGVGYFDGSAFVVEQWLLRRFGEEMPMLAALEARLASASGIVTYNGKSFDWPLLRTRYVLHRRRAPVVPAHVDLLHCARRLVKHRVSSTRLVELERALLGHVRVDDIDGALIPEVFMQLARHGHHPDVPRVLDHNAMDLVAMPALLARLAAQLTGTLEGAAGEDHLACTRVLSRAGDEDGVMRFASFASEAGDDDPAAHALLIAARHARSRGEVAETRALLERAHARATLDLTRAHVALALSKHFEHRERDLERAVAHARETELAEGTEASARRVARLLARAARVSPPSAARGRGG